MAGTLQKNPQYKNYMSDAKNNVADGAGVTPLDTRYIVAQNKPGGLPQTLTSGLQGAAAHILSDATAGVVGNAILATRPTANDFAAMGVTQIVVSAAVVIILRLLQSLRLLSMVRFGKSVCRSVSVVARQSSANR